MEVFIFMYTLLALTVFFISLFESHESTPMITRIASALFWPLVIPYLMWSLINRGDTTRKS